MTTSLHECGGTILDGCVPGYPHLYCDRCGAYAYTSWLDPRCVPAGTDEQANRAAHDAGEPLSPGPVLVRVEEGLSLCGVDAVVDDAGMTQDQTWSEALDALLVPLYYPDDDALLDDGTLGVFAAPDGRVGATWWTGDGWTLVWMPRQEEDDEDDGATYPRSWYDVAIARGAQVGAYGSITGAELSRVGIAVLNGCPGCGATVSAGNSFQTRRDDPWMWCRGCAEVT